MKDLVNFIAQELVEDPQSVTVKEIRRGNQIKLELQVSKTDMGRVIGKGGKIANAIRTLLRVSAEKAGKKATLDVVEP
ncbi:MAG TPA: KH domain-containing protein [Anaerolineales bacterium]|nr:KH domain-containing protein [Anaerolineales bacterium]